MATPKAAWGIEIGAYAIKAIRLERDGDEVKVSDFAVIPHRKVLTTPDLDQDEMVRLGLGQFISQKNLEGEHLVMSVPGHSAFARFAKLPPVEPKKVPDIVKFEAVQQIPFPIDEVEWDYQTFTSLDTPEIEVGIFAITRERVQQRLGLYSELGLTPESMTLSPVSVFNALSYDMGLGANEGQKKGPVVFIDIGTQATDVIVAEAGRCWIRTFPLGGTHFTEAIASAFKLSYSKAEKLKLEASDSKYAKQIMQAMRPVFSDLLQDLQRSISYYQSLHRESHLSTMIGIGSTFKIPGLRKFLSQQLAADSSSKFEIIRLDEYKRIGVTGREAASFAENAVNMATAYGLALQGVGLAPIDANLVPVKALRESMWHSKVKWFAAAAALVIIGAGMTFYRPIIDRSAMRPVPPAVVNDVISRGNQLKSNFETIKARSDVGATATNMLALLSQRDVWPHLLDDCASALASTDPQPELLGDKPELIIGIDPKVRRLVQLDELQCEYIPPSGTQKSRRVAVTMLVELSHDRPDEFLNGKVAKWLRDNAEPVGARASVPYRIIPGSISTNPTKLVTIDITAGGEEKKTEQMASGPTPRPGSSRTINNPAAPKPPDGMKVIQTPSAAPTASPDSGGDIATGGTRKPAQSQPPRTTGPRPPVGQQQPGQPRVRISGSGQDVDVLSMANMPRRPLLYPPNSRYYTIPVTFEIELIEQPAAAPGTTTAGMGRDGGAA
jgi:type IV pilus assembly protein PilM